MVRFRSRPIRLCTLPRPVRVGLAALTGSALVLPIMASPGHALEIAQVSEEVQVPEESIDLGVEQPQVLDAGPGEIPAEAIEAGQSEAVQAIPVIDEGATESEQPEVEAAEAKEAESVNAETEIEGIEADEEAEATDEEAEGAEVEADEAEKTPPLSLERPNEDPLLPGQVDGRALTPQELQRLRVGLKRLRGEAEVAALQGDRSGSYRKFFRFLSLSQYLPEEEELANLALVGRRTWRDNLGKEAQLITARVKTLETEGDEKLLLSHRRELAEAYDSLGAWTQAITHYEGLLAAQQPKGGEKPVLEAEGDGLAGEATSDKPSALNIGPLSAQSLDELTLVRRLAQLSMFSLNYPSAALYTEQALKLVPAVSSGQATGDASRESFADKEGLGGEGASATGLSGADDLPLDDTLPSEIGPTPTASSLLIQLAYVYEQDQRFAEAATTQQQIIPLYGDPSLLYRQPALQVAIARNQTRAGQLVEAIASYQEAYRQAQSLQQFAVSDDALSQLAALYRTEGQLDDALAVYDILLQVNDLSFNLYGIADTQASRAEIFVEQQQMEQASQAYLQAIYAARLLGYREAELQQQLDQLTIP